MRIFITGATGKLGAEVLKKIPTAIPLVRKKSGLAKEVVTDFSVEELKQIFARAACVIHLAGSLKFYDAADLYRSNVQLTKNIVAALPHKCKLVFASSISVYGKKLAELPADEKTSVNPDSPYAKTKYEAEKTALFHKNTVALRIGAIYSTRQEEYGHFLRLLKKQRLFIIGNGNNHIPFVHVEDVTGAIVNAVRRKVPRGVYVVSGESLTQKKIYEIAAASLNVPSPTIHLPKSIALSVAAIDELRLKIYGGKPFLTREHVGILAGDRIFNCSKAKKYLVFKPRLLEKGIREMAGKFKSGKFH